MLLLKNTEQFSLKSLFKLSLYCFFFFFLNLKVSSFCDNVFCPFWRSFNTPVEVNTNGRENANSGCSSVDLYLLSGVLGLFWCPSCHSSSCRALISNCGLEMLTLPCLSMMTKLTCSCLVLVFWFVFTFSFLPLYSLDFEIFGILDMLTFCYATCLYIISLHNQPYGVIMKATYYNPYLLIWLGGHL